MQNHLTQDATNGSVEVVDPTVICGEELNNIQLAKNPVFHAQTKHIEVHYHFVREPVLFGKV